MFNVDQAVMWATEHAKADFTTVKSVQQTNNINYTAIKLI